mmetsp:Transcript_120781/g.376109  ORF Transcript_120781/g.376109 Transcript_120781/m.376109 type:complete len:189 (-) Transcript_120781:8-574(-)
MTTRLLAGCLPSQGRATAPECCSAPSCWCRAAAVLAVEKLLLASGRLPSSAFDCSASSCTRADSATALLWRNAADEDADLNGGSGVATLSREGGLLQGSSDGGVHPRVFSVALRAYLLGKDGSCLRRAMQEPGEAVASASAAFLSAVLIWAAFLSAVLTWAARASEALERRWGCIDHQSRCWPEKAKS